jgi:hypothetical protein
MVREKEGLAEAENTSSFLTSLFSRSTTDTSAVGGDLLGGGQISPVS